METPLKYFADVRDPRVDRTREHLLEEILLLTIAAVLSGASGWNENRRLWPNQDRMVQEFFRLPGGIPSYDTFNRVFSALDPRNGINSAERL
jgi:hypothetical protein